MELNVSDGQLVFALQGQILKLPHTTVSVETIHTIWLRFNAWL